MSSNVICVVLKETKKIVFSFRECSFVFSIKVCQSIIEIELKTRLKSIAANLYYDRVQLFQAGWNSMQSSKLILIVHYSNSDGQYFKGVVYDILSVVYTVENIWEDRGQKLSKLAACEPSFTRGPGHEAGFSLSAMSSMYGIQPQTEMSHIHGVCDPHMNSLSLQVCWENYLQMKLKVLNYSSNYDFFRRR